MLWPGIVAGPPVPAVPVPAVPAIAAVAAPVPSVPVAIPAGATSAVTDAGLLRAHLNQLSPPFARAAHLASSLGADPKLFRPTPARATSQTWSMVRSASLPNLDEIESEEDESEVRLLATQRHTPCAHCLCALGRLPLDDAA